MAVSPVFVADVILSTQNAGTQRGNDVPACDTIQPQQLET
jgi:hypothetical protein